MSAGVHFTSWRRQTHLGDRKASGPLLCLAWLVPSSRTNLALSCVACFATCIISFSPGSACREALPSAHVSVLASQFETLHRDVILTVSKRAATFTRFPGLTGARQVVPHFRAATTQRTANTTQRRGLPCFFLLGTHRLIKNSDDGPTRANC